MTMDDINKLSEEMIEAAYHRDPCSNHVTGSWGAFLGGARAAERLLATPPVALAQEALAVPEDTQRLDWLLPNLHPATFGFDFEWDTDAEFLAGWRRVIDEELRGQAARHPTSSTEGEAHD